MANFIHESGNILRLALPAHEEAFDAPAGGVSGRPMNRRASPAETDDREAARAIHAGSMIGTNRSPKVLQRQRKHRWA